MERQLYQWGICRTCRDTKVVHRDNGDEREGRVPVGTCTDCENNIKEATNGEE